MKNKVIQDMVCSQFGWDFRDVDVEFKSVINGVYEFHVVHWCGELTQRKVIKVQSFDCYKFPE